MSFIDEIRVSILQGFETDITTTKIIVTLLFSFIIGVIIYFIYKYKTKSSFYSKDFNVTLIGLPVITAAIVLSMQVNIVVSLGMVGALSIVRFRNAVKNQLDLLFLFWSISVGIICGAGIYELALISSLLLSAMLLIIDLLPVKKESLLLIINAKDIKIEEKVMSILKKNKVSYKLKSKNIHNKNIDMIFEIRSKRSNDVVKSCLKLKNIENVGLISHDGDSRL